MLSCTYRHACLSSPPVSKIIRGSRVQVWGSGLEIYGMECEVRSLECCVQDSDSRVWGSAQGL